MAGSVILSGLVIVFLILIFLIWCVHLTGKAINGTNRQPAGNSRPAPPAGNAMPVVPASPAAPVVQQGIEEETVAAISAAVYCCMAEADPGVSYAIKSINRVTGGRPVWGFAGMQQNTRPF